MNILSGFFTGYNPGFSGERIMQQFQEKTEWGEGEGMRRPSPQFDPNYPWGVFAPEGGERQYTYLPQEQIVEAQPSLAVSPKKEVAPETIIAPSYTVDNIDPQMKAVFDRILNSDEVRREIFFKDMATEDKNAFVEYNNSIRERQLAEEDK